jgi:hypothetical protein
VTNWLSHLGDPASVGLIGAALAAVALVRGRPRVALAVLVLLAATSVSSQVLKALLAYPRYDGVVEGISVDPAAFPSGHATAAMSLALAGVLVAPRRARPLAAFVGCSLALGVSYSVLSHGSHFPSDIVGGFLLATWWTLVLVAALSTASERWPERSGRTQAGAMARTAVDRGTTVGLAAGAAAIVAAVVLAGAVVLLTRLPDALDFASRHTGFVAVAGAVAAAAAVLLACLTALLGNRG